MKIKTVLWAKNRAFRSFFCDLQHLILAKNSKILYLWAFSKK